MIEYIQKSRNIKLNDCIQEFKYFLDIEYGGTTPLDEQLKLFSNFNFDNIFNIEYITKKTHNDENLIKFYYKLQEGGKGEGRKSHKDSTRLARIVYYIIHNNEYKTDYSLPELQSFYDITYNNYSGETLNNFGFANIGNFMLLPKKTHERKSLNTVKGMTCYGYNDYFDLFWIDVFNFLNNKYCENFDLIKNIINENKFYFENISQKEFIKINFLEDYFDTNCKPKKLYKHNASCNDDSIIAQNLINRRNKKIVKVLTNIIKKYKEII